MSDAQTTPSAVGISERRTLKLAAKGGMASMWPPLVVANRCSCQSRIGARTICPWRVEMVERLWAWVVSRFKLPLTMDAPKRSKWPKISYPFQGTRQLWIMSDFKEGILCRSERPVILSQSQNKQIASSPAWLSSPKSQLRKAACMADGQMRSTVCS